MKQFPGRLHTIITGRPILWSVLLITTALLLTYSASFTADWHYDDHHHIRENISVRKLSNVPAFFTDPSTFSRIPKTVMVRPLLMTSHALNYRMGLASHGDGYTVIWYHITNFLMHLAASLCVFGIALFLFRHKISIRSASPVLAATFAGLFFGLHPINTEAVVYISSRSAGMASLFVFLAFYGYLHATNSQRPAIYVLVLSTLSYAWGLLTKEIAITLPAMLFFYEFTVNREWMAGNRAGNVLWKLAGRWSPYLGVTLAYLWYRNQVLGGENLVGRVISQGGRTAAPDLTAQIATQSRVWTTYIRETLWPMGLSVDKPFAVNRHFMEPGVILAGLAVIGIIAAVLAVSKKHALITFGTLWFFTALVPESVIRLNVVLNDHRVYYSGLGFSLVLTYVLVRLFGKIPDRSRSTRKAAVALCLAILIFLGAGTFRRTMAFATEETLWKDVLLKDPGSARAHNNLGIFFEGQRRFEEAIGHYQQAIELSPRFLDPLVNLGDLFGNIGDLGRAKEYLQRAVIINPSSDILWYNLGIVHRKNEDLGEARIAYQRAIVLNPRFSKAMNNLADLYFISGDPQTAITLYTRALDLDPALGTAYFGRGLAFERQGMLQEALSDYRRAVTSSQIDEVSKQMATAMIDSLSKQSGR